MALDFILAIFLETKCQKLSFCFLGSIFGEVGFLVGLSVLTSSKVLKCEEVTDHVDLCKLPCGAVNTANVPIVGGVPKNG